MKISHVEAIPLEIPVSLIGPAPNMFGQSRAVSEFVLVRIETDIGIVGWGETLMYCNRAVQVVIEDMVAPLLIGQDASDITGLMRKMLRSLHQWGRQGLVMFAISAVDIALWDIAGKAVGMPIYRLLGAAPNRTITPYASMVHCDTPEMAAEQARAAAREGYRYVKLHVGGEEEVRAARKALGSEVALIVDANCRWSPGDAREALGWMRKYDPLWIEEPIFPPEDFRSLARLRVESGMPIAAGENVYTPLEFEAMFAAEAVTFAQPSVIKVGGITEFRKIATLAETHGVELRPQSFSLGPGLLATLHLLAAQPHAALVERPFCTIPGDLCGPATRVVDGVMVPPDGPGLGHDPDLDMIREFCTYEWDERKPGQLTNGAGQRRRLGPPSPVDMGRMLVGQVMNRLGKNRRP